MEKTLLAVRDLHTWFELRRFGLLHAGFVRAVDGVSFAIARDETVAFVGESGCGKSSLARTLLGLHQPTAGEITFAGRRRETMTGRERRELQGRIGYIQQDPYSALPPFMNIGRILAEPLLIHRRGGRTRIEACTRAALAETGLPDSAAFRCNYPHMLSGGQQQRVVIARALVTAPDMIVADEPVSMIDAPARVDILDMLRRIRLKRRLAMAIITHDLSTVRYFADRIMVMYAGRIIEQAPAEQLVTGPAHPYTRALLAAIPDPDPDNARRQQVIPGGEPPSLVTPPGGCRFHPRCPEIIDRRCTEETPPDFTVGANHRCACWRHQPGFKQNRAAAHQKE